MVLVLGLGISGRAFAYQGDFTKNGPNYTPDFEAQITDALTHKDYQEWKNLVEDKIGTVDSAITQDNFDKFTQAWELAKEGKIKEANAIRRELELSSKSN